MKLIKNCEVCKEVLHKYKCPSCLVLYCSLECFKKHKKEDYCVKNIASPKPNDEIQQKPQLLIDEEDVLNEERLVKLSQSKELKEILKNPHLRKMLTSLDSARHKKSSIEQCMQEPIFVEFADTCLSVVRH